jgi:hypothetical protein
VRWWSRPSGLFWLFGFSSGGIHLIALCRPLYDPQGIIAEMKAATSPYPDRLREVLLITPQTRLYGLLNRFRFWQGSPPRAASIGQSSEVSYYRERLAVMKLRFYRVIELRKKT